MERQCVKRHMWHRRTIGLWSSSRYPCLWTVGLSSGEWRSRAAKLQYGPVPRLLCGVGKQGWRGSPGEQAAIRIYIFIRDQSYVLFLSLFSLLFLSVIHTHAQKCWDVLLYHVSELDRPCFIAYSAPPKVQSPLMKMLLIFPHIIFFYILYYIILLEQFKVSPKSILCLSGGTNIMTFCKKLTWSDQKCIYLISDLEIVKNLKYFLCHNFFLSFFFNLLVLIRLLITYF